ncbi:hypothetical protein N9Z67_01020 [Rhodopirellula sp.]|nr:hypothetical protein [Rhodopirellula sp.]
MKKLIVVIGLLLLVAADNKLVAAELSEQRCKKLVAELQPGKDAVWRTIPWKLSVLEARAASLKEDKPIFIWAMDGHPLGCT